MTGDQNGTTDRPGARAVSYALGFVVVFSLVVAGTLALFATGVDLLSDVDRDETVAANGESLAVIHSEVGDMAASGADRRGMRLDLVDAQIRVSDSPRVTLRVESDDIDLSGGIEYETRALLYEIPTHGTTFVYALGHAYRVDEGGGALSETPPVFETSRRQTRLVVPVLVGPTDGGPTSIGVSGTGERELVALRSGTPASLTRTNTENGSVEPMTGTVTVEGVDHPPVWVEALEATGFDNVTQTTTAGAGAVVGTFSSERLTVRQADIRFALGGADR